MVGNTLAAGILAVLGIPAGILVAKFSSEEQKEVKKYLGVIRKTILIAGIAACSFLFQIPFALALSLMSLLIFFFEPPAIAVLPIAAIGVYFARSNIAIVVSFIFTYCIFVGAGLYSPKSKTSEYAIKLLQFLPYPVILIFLSVLSL